MVRTMPAVLRAVALLMMANMEMSVIINLNVDETVVFDRCFVLISTPMGRGTKS